MDQIRQANDQRQQKLAELQKKKALEEEMVQNANNLLDKAKSLLNAKEFDASAEYYQQAGKVLRKSGGLNKQICFSKKSIMFIIKKRFMNERIADEQAKQTRLQQEISVSGRTNSVKNKKKKQRRIESERNKLSPELQRKVDTGPNGFGKSPRIGTKEKWDKALPV